MAAPLSVWAHPLSARESHLAGMCVRTRQEAGIVGLVAGLCAQLQMFAVCLGVFLGKAFQLTNSNFSI